MIKVLKVIVFFLCLAPFVWLVYGAVTYNIGADPAGTVRAVTGRWTLRLLLITAPLHRFDSSPGGMPPSVSGGCWGYSAFFWALGDFITYLLVQGFNWPLIGEDISQAAVHHAGAAQSAALGAHDSGFGHHVNQEMDFSSSAANDGRLQ